MRLGRYIFLVALPGILIGLLVTGLTVHAWLSENLHGNFYNQDTGEVDWQFTIMISVYCFTVVFVVTSFIVAVGIAAFTGLRSLLVRFRHK